MPGEISNVGHSTVSPHNQNSGGENNTVAENELVNNIVRVSNSSTDPYRGHRASAETAPGNVQKDWPTNPPDITDENWREQGAVLHRMTHPAVPVQKLPNIREAASNFLLLCAQLLAGNANAKLKAEHAHANPEQQIPTSPHDIHDPTRVIHKQLELSDDALVSLLSGDMSSIDTQTGFVGIQIDDEIQIKDINSYSVKLDKNYYDAINETDSYNFIKSKESMLGEYYTNYNLKYPNVKILGRSLLKEKIKEKFNLDIDPDEVHFILFESIDNYSQYNPKIDKTLTEWLFSNFDVSFQNNLQDMDAMCGIYSKPKDNNAQKYHKSDAVEIKPTDFIKLVWDIDFYKQAMSMLTNKFKEKDVQIKKYFLDFVCHLNLADINNKAAKDILNGVGLLNDDSVKTTLFDINGYTASNAFVFKNNKNGHVSLYFPQSDFKFMSFGSHFEMQQWVTNACATKEHRDMIASHFTIANRQDGEFYYGVDAWLKSINENNSYHKVIANKNTEVSQSKFFEALLHNVKEKTISDLDSIIKSDAEIKRDLWEDIIDGSNIIPNPVSPFLSLAIHIEHALEGDTYEERMREWNKIKDDAVNLLSMVVLDKVVNINGMEGYEFIDNVKSGMVMDSGEFEHLSTPSTKRITASRSFGNEVREIELIFVGYEEGQPTWSRIDPVSGVIAGKKYTISSDGKLSPFEPKLSQRLEKILNDGLGGKGSKIAKKKWAEDLTDSEIQSLNNYGRVDSQAINEYMVSGMPDEYITPSFANSLRNNINNIRSGLNKIKPVRGTVFRGAKIRRPIYDSLSKNTIVSSKAFMSSSLNKEIALNFASGSSSANAEAMPVLYKIHIEESGHPISTYTGKFDEEEILIEDNTLFTVISKGDGQIEIREISDNSLDSDQLESVVYIDSFREYKAKEIKLPEVASPPRWYDKQNIIKIGGYHSWWDFKDPVTPKNGRVIRVYTTKYGEQLRSEHIEAFSRFYKDDSASLSTLATSNDVLLVAEFTEVKGEKIKDFLNEKNAKKIKSFTKRIKKEDLVRKLTLKLRENDIDAGSLRFIELAYDFESAEINPINFEGAKIKTGMTEYEYKRIYHIIFNDIVENGLKPLIDKFNNNPTMQSIIDKTIRAMCARYDAEVGML